ncbi:MAG TPA: hypothetical protein VFY29_09480 [Terriglobia bacterium]|nr:hypothetical protein [Terriglobia bacterium]
MTRRLKNHPRLVIGIAMLVVGVSFVGYLALQFSSDHWGPCKFHEETKTTTLLPSTHSQRLVYETDIVIVSIGYDQFLDYLEVESQQVDRPNHEATQRYFDHWLASVQTALHDSGSALLTIERDERFIAWMLEHGKASVFDKRNRSWVTTINARHQSVGCGLGGGVYRIFHLPDRTLFNRRGTPFLEIRDLIV